MNQYDSKLATFLGMDSYNLVMPAVPPADLSIPATDFVMRYLADRESGSFTGGVFGFDRRDNPFIRKLGFFSNLADGLVDIAQFHTSIVGGFEIQFALDRFFARLTGTIANTAGSAAVTGGGTLFTRELVPGQILVWNDDNYVTRRGTILSITDDTNLTLTAVTASTGMFAGNSTASRARPCVLFDSSTFILQVPTLNQLFTRAEQISDVSMIRPITGLSTFAGATPAVGATTMAVTGVGTRYLRDVTVGQAVRYGTGADQRTLIVAAVASDVAMTLTVPASGDLPVAFTYPALASTTLSWMDDSLGVRVLPRAPLSLSTIAMDSGFGVKRLSFHIVAEIEHSFTVLGTM